MKTKKKMKLVTKEADMKAKKKMKLVTKEADALPLPLPREVIFDIFSRLCMDQLFSSIFVSKNWFGIIKNPLFVDSLKHHPNFSFLVMYSPPTKSVSLVDITTQASKFKVIKSLPLCPDHFPKESPNLIASSNGLLCFQSPPDLRSHYIFNPFTKDTVPLPPAPFMDLPAKCLGLRRRDPTPEMPSSYITAPSGFAFDVITNTYKLIHAWSFEYDGGSVQKAVFSMHVLGSISRKWTRVHEMFATFTEHQDAPVFLNNTLHWQMYADTNFQYVIGGIKLADATFTQLKTPPKSSNNNYKCLSSLNGLLSLIYETDAGYIVLWTMDDYGRASSWSRKYSITLRNVLPLFSRRSRQWLTSSNGFRVLTTMKNGNILLADGQFLLCCDFEKNEHQVLEVAGLPPAYTRQYTAPVAHVGSLISPKIVAPHK